MDLLDVHGTGKGDMVHIVKASAVKATYHVHYIIEDDRFVEGALLRYNSSSVDAAPFAVFNLVTEQVVESLLARVDTAKDKDGGVHHDG